jgi:hypothetical protein
MSPGKFYHFSLTNSLSRVLECVPDNEIPHKISIHVNVDGLPMCKSTNGAFWPILVNATNLPVAVPFLCGLFYGPKKPDDFNELLRRFIDEASYLECEGFAYNEQYFDFEVGAFICDSPATSSVKGTSSHTGYWSCNKCVTKGERVLDRTVFTELDAAKRTDQSFRDREDQNHHRILHELEVERLKMSMVDGFPKESLHLLDLGVTKRHLQFLIGNVKSPAKLPKKKLTKCHVD